MSIHDEFTPTTENVRSAYSTDIEGEYRDPINAASNQRWAERAFDRWLAAHDAEIRASMTTDPTPPADTTLREKLEDRVQFALFYKHREQFVFRFSDPRLVLGEASYLSNLIPTLLPLIAAEVAKGQAEGYVNGHARGWLGGKLEALEDVERRIVHDDSTDLTNQSHSLSVIRQAITALIRSTDPTGSTK